MGIVCGNFWKDTMTYFYTILYVRDVQRAMAFYQQVFALQEKFCSPEKDYAELVTGSVTLAFARLELAKSNLSRGFTPAAVNDLPFGMEIGFESTDVGDTVQKAIAAGGTLCEQAQSKPWGQTVAYVRDLDGFLVAIGSPMAE